MLTKRNALLLLGAGFVGGGAYTLIRSDGDAPAASIDLGAAHAQGAAEIDDITLGDPSAPVTVVEYASYTCPHCANFHNDTFKDFRREYIDTGKVHFIYREVFFDRPGLWASMVARCAGADRYHGVSELLYRQQAEWARQPDPVSIVASLKKIGAQAGLSGEELDACLQDGEQAQSLVAWYQANAERDNIRSTPSFLINGELHAGNMSLSRLGQLVDDAAG